MPVAFRPASWPQTYRNSPPDNLRRRWSRRGEFFDGRRLMAVLGDSAGRSAHEAKGAVLNDVARFAGDVAQADDITLLVLAHTNGRTNRPQA
ncbi:MAG: hypothetical protein ACOC9X_00950 [bacterium]